MKILGWALSRHGRFDEAVYRIRRRIEQRRAQPSFSWIQERHRRPTCIVAHGLKHWTALHRQWRGQQADYDTKLPPRDWRRNSQSLQRNFGMIFGFFKWVKYFRQSWTLTWSQKQKAMSPKCFTWKWKAITTDIWPKFRKTTKKQEARLKVC